MLNCLNFLERFDSWLSDFLKDKEGYDYDNKKHVETDLDKVFMHTSGGKVWYPFAPNSDDVDIEVIAHHLATRARWNGATVHPRNPEKIFYSVAEHSVYVAMYVDQVMNRPDLAFPLPRDVKIADDAVCNAEFQQIIPRDEDADALKSELCNDSVTAPYVIEMLDPYDAKMFFLDYYHSLVQRGLN